MASRCISNQSIRQLVGAIRSRPSHVVQRAHVSMFRPSKSMTEGLMDSIVRSDSAWVDAPTTVIEDPLHPNGFDFHVNLDQLPSTTSGVAAFEKNHIRSGNLHDPFELVSGEITSLSEGIRSLLGSDHPVLELCARYFFESGRDGGKKVRPTMVLLISLATNHHSTIRTPQNSVGAMAAPASSKKQILSTQRRLAEITEMIHTASLFHDDVIDTSDTRRGVPSAHRAYGDKLAILAGDFLLARASVALARLRNLEVVELLSTVIEHLVKGEVMQMRGGHLKNCSAMEYYLHKNYYKTGSLMANSCRAASVLGGHDSNVQDVAFAYGKHIGLAFQLVDDILDFEGSITSLGKPALADLKAGLATAPVLLAADEFPRLQVLIDRKFAELGDVDEALKLVQKSRGLQRTKDLAVAQADLAINAVLSLEPSPARDALAHLAFKVISRNN